MLKNLLRNEAQLKLSKNKETIDNLVIDFKCQFKKLPTAIIMPDNVVPIEYVNKSTINYDDTEIPYTVSLSGTPIILIM